MKTISLHTPCPGCQGPLNISAARCDACDITVHGHFQTNEFASLSEEELHFLRIFVFAEGRVRDMEGPLGLSYPTIRNRLTQLKEKLQAAAAEIGSPPPVSTTKLRENEQSKAAPQPDHILEQLDRGEIDFNEALKTIRAAQKGPKERKPHDK